MNNPPPASPLYTSLLFYAPTSPFTLALLLPQELIRPSTPPPSHSLPFPLIFDPVGQSAPEGWPDVVPCEGKGCGVCIVLTLHWHPDTLTLLRAQAPFTQRALPGILQAIVSQAATQSAEHFSFPLSVSPSFPLSVLTLICGICNKTWHLGIWAKIILKKKIYLK